MSKQVKRRRGTTTEHGSFVGSAGEITVDTTLNTAVVHDGSQTGGYPLCKADLTNADLLNKISVAELNVADGISGQVLSTNGSGSLVFINSGGIIANSVGITELDVNDGTAGQYLTTDGSGSLSFSTDNTNVGTTAVGGDVSGTVGNIQISANTVGITELNVSDGTAGQLLSTDGSGTLSFSSPTGVSANSIGITELNVSDGTAGQVLKTNGSGTLGFTTPGSENVGGDLSGSISNASIVSGAVGITELDVSDGTSGQLLSTNGSGVLSFIPQLTSLSVGGDLTGTTDNAVIAAGAVEDSMIVGIAAAKIIGGTGFTGMQVFTTAGSFTWTKPSGVKSVLYFVTGGGGGVPPGGNSSAAPSGGGGGATAMGFLDVASIASKTGTVGAGGVGTGTTQGGTGGTTTFGSTISALGGNGGGLIGGASNGLGGTATGGQLNMPGGVGQAHGDTGSATSFAAGGVTFFAAIGSGARGHIGGTSTGNVGNSGAVIILEFA